MMRAGLFPISLLLSSAACSSQADYARQTGIESDPAATATARASAAPGLSARPVAFTDNEARDGGEREFGYKWPALVSAEPKLVEQLTAERTRILANEKTEWPEALDGSPEDCGGCRNRSFEKEWEVVANTPGYLSLSGDFSTYTGGAHGMYGVDAIVWDRAAQKVVPTEEMFVSSAALDKALGPKLCAALNKEREKRRGEPVKPTEDDLGFDSCQYTKDATVLIGSSNGKQFNRIGVWFGPYVAGPYAEGAYELTFPVDAAVIRAVKPEYAGAFSAGR